MEEKGAELAELDVANVDFLFQYVPRNEKYDAFSERLFFVLKQRHRMKYEAREVDKLVKTRLMEFLRSKALLSEGHNTVFVCVPSSKKICNGSQNGVCQILKECLLENFDMSVVLERTAALSENEKRVVERQIETLKISNTEALLGKQVVVIDDVLTSGATLTGVYSVLLKARINVVKVLAIASTNQGNRFIVNHETTP